MKKRVLAVVLVMVCVLASSIAVSAAKSSTADVTVNESHEGYYKIRTGADAFVYDKGDADSSNDEVISVKDDIIAFNEGKKTIAQVLDSSATVLKALENKTAITKIFDLHDVNGGQVGNDGLHRVKIHVNALTDKCSDVKVLHYSMVDEKWEILDKSEVNISKKTVTVVTDDLSPIAIFATVATGEGTGETLPPMAGTSTTWMLFAGAAIVVLGASAIATKKRSY